MTDNQTPTEIAYGQLQYAYHYFNERLWDNELPHCLLTFTRKKRVYGYFGPSRFTDGEAKVDELAMNIEYLKTRPAAEAVSTLIHEMVHVWQQHFGHPSRSGYHNAEWADEMERIGLMPSDTGAPGGKRTGQQVSHFIIEGGAYDLAWKELQKEGFELTWGALVPPAAATCKGGTNASGKRTKFVCPMCEAAAWGKPSLRIMCGDCVMFMQAAE